MADKRNLDLNLLAYLPRNRKGSTRVMSFGAPGSATLRPMCDSSFDVVLGYDRSTGPPDRLFYCVRLQRFLDPDRTLNQQGVVDGEVLVFTDQHDSGEVQTFAEAALRPLKTAPPPTSINARWLEALRELVGAVPYVGKALAVLIFGAKPGK